MRTVALLVLVLCLSSTAGCFVLDERQVTPVATPAPATPFPITDSGMSTIEPAEMALALSDLPVGYIIRERSDIAYSDISPLAREQGWKKGYLVSFYRMNAEKYDITAISQRIGVYQIDNIHLLDRTMGPVFETAESDLFARANVSVSVTELPFPKIGDQTVAFRIIDANDPYQVTKYVVLFTTKNVIESVEMRGTTTDYELLKSLVKKAADKIR
jgi:hypothetical protein